MLPTTQLIFFNYGDRIKHLFRSFMYTDLNSIAMITLRKEMADCQSLTFSSEGNKCQDDILVIVCSENGYMTTSSSKVDPASTHATMLSNVRAEQGVSSQQVDNSI